ncbi:MAG: hypothetical protein COV72_07425 [Candidatus Omnitrophica bacterium CG11_big_fil_rev_8_21_14_0_20_42_13]|uniref:YggT family protein n=1 Tax=Candidatus Ghiorseimicrobium undicola TaxID=1974746 RepID=A0A2H0LVV3_9BACT|nr:MAG: hypothetical protein COV72_07425 [Candidatus Omnitrophica bacterium CG11_big_fil_rev_8_21_14_0_20_42_13]
MFVIANFLIFLGNIFYMFAPRLLDFFVLIIIIRVIISWVHADPYNPLVQFINKITEPVLYPIRKMLPSDFRFGIDISPMIAVFAIYVLQYFLRSFLAPTLFDLAAQLK